MKKKSIDFFVPSRDEPFEPLSKILKTQKITKLLLKKAAS